MKKKEPELKLDPREVTSESELRELLTIYTPESEAQARKTLIDGFELLQTRAETEAKLEEVDKEDFGGYIPAPLTMSPSIMTLDNFIRRSMGGERDGLHIKWAIDGVTWVFDPWTGELNAERDS